MNLSAPDHPANAGLRRHFEPRQKGSTVPRLAVPEQIARPYETLGTHPDLVARLWDEPPSRLPVNCRVVFLARWR